MKAIIQDLRTAYEGHDHDAFHATLKRLERDYVKRDSPCTRGTACVCDAHAQAVCMHRKATTLPEPTTK